MTKQTMIRNYRRFSAAEGYILGFAKNHKVYMVMVEEIMPRFLTVEQASRNQGDNLRLRLRKDHIERFMTQNPIYICEESELVDSKWNKGEMFEKFITEYFGQTWEKDTIGFDVQGDINIDGAEIQIKYNNATLVNSKRIKRLQNLAR